MLIVGFALYMALSVPSYFDTYTAQHGGAGPINTSNEQFNGGRGSRQGRVPCDFSWHAGTSGTGCCAATRGVHVQPLAEHTQQRHNTRTAMATLCTPRRVPLPSPA